MGTQRILPKKARREMLSIPCRLRRIFECSRTFSRRGPMLTLAGDCV